MNHHLFHTSLVSRVFLRGVWALLLSGPATSRAQTPLAARQVTLDTASEDLFSGSEALGGVAHREKLYPDFQRQPLLPNKMSQLGPGLAWGDADGDGDDDLGPIVSSLTE